MNDFLAVESDTLMELSQGAERSYKRDNSSACIKKESPRGFAQQLVLYVYSEKGSLSAAATRATSTATVRVGGKANISRPYIFIIAMSCSAFVIRVLRLFPLAFLELYRDLGEERQPEVSALGWL